MEPEELTPPSRDEEALRSLARELSPELRDDGFTARVLGALPPARAARSPLPRPWIVALAGAFLGLGFALWRGATWDDALSGVSALGNAMLSVSAQFENPWMLAALALSGVSVLIALELARRGEGTP